MIKIEMFNPETQKWEPRWEETVEWCSKEAALQVAFKEALFVLNTSGKPGEVRIIIPHKAD